MRDTFITDSHDDGPKSPLETGICPKCEQQKSDVDEQYSYGVYAGIMCTDCAVKSFTDCCGHRPEGQGDYRELDEPYWEDA